MTKQEHIAKHKQLHESLDELVADMITENGGEVLPSRMTVMELIKWSHQQTLNPSDKCNQYPDAEAQTEKPL